MTLEHLGTPLAPMTRVHGGLLNRMYRLDTDRGGITWTHVSIEEPMATDWPELAERAAATGQAWADELTAHVDAFLAMARFVDTCERPGPEVLTHKDINQKNLLTRDGRPVVLDWEVAGKLELASELGSTAVNLAKVPQRRGSRNGSRPRAVARDGAQGTADSARAVRSTRRSRASAPVMFTPP